MLSTTPKVAQIAQHYLDSDMTLQMEAALAAFTTEDVETLIRYFTMLQPPPDQ